MVYSNAFIPRYNPFLLFVDQSKVEEKLDEMMGVCQILLIQFMYRVNCYISPVYRSEFSDQGDSLFR